MKNFVKDLIFIIVFIILFHICSNVFVLKGNTYGSDVISFYNLKPNSLDLIFFGSSHSYATFSPDVIEDKTNLNSYNFATQQQPISITYYYMKEALKTQKPKYFVLDINMLSQDEKYSTEGVTRDAIDKMKLSVNKIKAINDNVQNKDERISYYFNIIKYHTRYNELNLNDIKIGLTQKGINNRGFKALPADNSIYINNEKIIDNKELKEISKNNQIYLDKILKLANENKIKLILVKSPCTLTLKDQQNYNWVWDYAKKNDINFINYNDLIDDLNLTNGDFYDSGHLSENGAIKVSLHFADYLNEIKTK